MKVSVVIPNYNGEKFIDLCLSSLSKQSFKDYETIFVDNNSSDKSLEIVKGSYPEIKILALNENYGFSRAVNEGIRASKGEYVVLLNNDTEAQEDWLQSLLTCIEGDNKIFSCCSKMLQFRDRTLIDDAGDEYNLLGWAYKRGDNLKEEHYVKSGEVFSSCAGAAIYRKSLFKVIGDFDESFFAYMEDMDISYRARICGFKNVYCSEAKIYHVGSGTSGSKYNSFKVKLAARNNVYVILKNMPPLQLLINSPFLIIGFFIKYVFFTRKGFSKEFRTGFTEAFKNIKNLEKVKFQGNRLINYLRIEYYLIVNTFRYVWLKLFK